MKICTLCPRNCAVDRENSERGICGQTEKLKVARAALHYWEEPCISGTKGSGAVFFSGCSLHCVFCQNKNIANGDAGKEISIGRITEIFLELQQKGANNINLVTPGHFVPQIITALHAAKQQGLTIPIVYNTSSYEEVDTIRRLEGLVDIYLPDFKYVSPLLSERFSGCADYYPVAAEAIAEMHRQVGILRLDAAGIARRGLLIRHLVLPGCIDDSRRVLDAIAGMLPRESFLSLMRQYAPTPNIEAPPLNRRLTDREYERICLYCGDLGFQNVYIQGRESADLSYTPDFAKSQ